MTSLVEQLGGRHDDALDERLRTALDEARALGVEHPTRHLEPWRATLATGKQLEGVRWAELLLVTACAAGERAALSSFDAAFLEPAAARVARQYPRVDPHELAQAMRERLLVGEGVARLRGWRGRGTLAAWLRAVATRLALDPSTSGRETVLDDAAWDRAIHELTSQQTPELAVLEQARRTELRAALSEALRRLPRREKVVLRLHVFQSLSTEQLGRVFHVAPSTVRRWIHGARNTVLENVRTMLTHTSRWSSSQIASALTHLSTLELSLSALTSKTP
ncbi:MAG: sigma-70 family RNA polymerase sigma factor [Myxococcota bacterium]